MGFGFGFFQWMDLLFPLMFILVVGIILVTLFRSIQEWNQNNHQPRLTVNAMVISKRNEHRHNMQTHTSHTLYYVTFQVESGDRMEFSVSGRDYGMLAEGDQGKLFFQGTRYLGFERQ